MARDGGRVRVWGRHVVAAVLRHHPERVVTLWVQDGLRLDPALAAELERHGLPWRHAPRARLDAWTEGAVHQGLVAELHPAPARSEADLEPLLAARSQALVLVLDGVQDPRNLGACLRCALGAGADAVIAPRDRAAGLTGVARKAACGAAELLPFVQVVNLARCLRRLREAGLWLIAADAGAPTPVWDAGLDRPLAWVLGGEGGGLRRLTLEHCDERRAIPLDPRLESLNVSAAAAVCLFETRRQRLAADRS